MTKDIIVEYHNKQKEVKLEDHLWWNKQDKEIHESIKSVINTLQERQAYRENLNYINARLYSNIELLTALNRNLPSQTRTSRITYNVVKSCIDTVASKIAKAKPKPQFLTDGGNYAQQQRAKNLTQYVEGVFYDTDLYEIAQKVFIDGCVFGTGLIKFYIENSKVKAERVLPTEIVVDEREATYGKPQQMHQTKTVNRSTLLALYPEHAEEIMIAEAIDSTQKETVDLVKVTESWHLPSTIDSKDGKHCITLSSCTLLSETYEKAYFPFVTYKWSDSLVGFFGQGLSEELTGMQVEINKLLQAIQKAQHLIAVPRVAVDSGSKISVGNLGNDIGSIFRYTGTKPDFFTPQAMNAEVYNHLKWLIQSAYEKTGVSQLSAGSKKPSGLDSGVALREFQDIESERFMLTGMRFEKMFLDASKIIIDLSRDIYKDNKSLKVNVKGSEFIETINWKDVDLADDKFIMKAYPVSLLPTTPEGKLAKVQELIQAGFITKEDGLSLLDFPDLKSVQNLDLAASKLIDKTIYLITDKGEYNPPEPEQNLQLLIKKAHQSYLKGRLDSLEQSKLELLLRLIDDSKRLIQMAAVGENPEAPIDQSMGQEAPTQLEELPTQGQVEDLPQTDLIPR